MRPSPGVTVRQYFFMSFAQALSSFATLAVSFSSIVFPRSVCAQTGLTDNMVANKGNNPSFASKRILIFIERPLMTGFELTRFCRWVMKTEGRIPHIIYCAKVSVRLETPRDRFIPTDPSTESGCKAIERPVPPNRRLAPTPTPTPIAPLAPT
jgi:hypothetical protein